MRQGTAFAEPSVALLGIYDHNLAFVPEWRNWQTRRTQNPVGVKLSGGSNPPSGTTSHSRNLLHAPSPLGPVSLRLTVSVETETIGAGNARTARRPMRRTNVRR